MKMFHLYKKVYNDEDERDEQYLYVCYPETGRYGFHNAGDRFCPEGKPLNERQVDFVMAGDINKKYESVEIH
jgi:hypothetical protein